MITALIDVNPIMKGDPQGEVEVRAEAKEMEDIAKKIRSIELNDPVQYLRDLTKVKGFQSASISIKGIEYRFNSLDDLGKEDAKRARPKGS